MTKKQTIILCVSIILICIFLVTIFLITNFSQKNKDDIPENSTINYEYYTQTINDIEWQITYDKTSKNIISISAYYSENDRSSKYWKEIAIMHGDSNLSVNHSISLIGKPLDDNWFEIEKHETYKFNNDILYNSITRYDEKLIFNLS